jgi:glycosyltransferase involved in cell wall biosynthesis
MRGYRYEILIPIYNDWESLKPLMERIRSATSAELFQQLRFTIVNDCSSLHMDYSLLPHAAPLTVIELGRNMGHQKAIAVGLSHIQYHSQADWVIVMDGDGEDKPEDVEKLIRHATENPDKIVFASRSKRHDKLVFRAFYACYKGLFRLLTGRRIFFGNFCIIPRPLLQNLVYYSEIWSHFSGGIIRSRLPYTSIPLERGRRFAGDSKMNFLDLMLHGLSSIAIYVDVISMRLLLMTVLLMLLSLAGMVVVLVIRLFTNLAIPGWATFAVLGFAIIALQAFLMSILLAFIVLHFKTQTLVIPTKDYGTFINDVKLSE